MWKFHNVLTNHGPSPRKFADKFIRENRKKPTNIIIFRLLGSVADESLNFDVFVRIIKNKNKIIITKQSTLSRRLDNLKIEVYKFNLKDSAEISIQFTRICWILFYLLQGWKSVKT